MSLTGTSLLVLAVVLLVLAPAATLLLWSRVRGPRPVRLLGRLGMLVTCQVAALLVGALVVNNEFQLYASWDDLLGRNNGPGKITLGSDAPGPHGTSAGRGPGQPSFTPYAGTNVLVTDFTGPRSAASGKVYVYLPPQYDDPRYAGQLFPVVELFHGHPGSPNTWFGNMNITGALNQQIAAGRSHPFILVMPDIEVDKPLDTECANLPGGPQTATYLVQDVRQLIVDSFRADPKRDAWGTMGYSTGGHCATTIAVRYPQYFKAAVGMAGYNAPVGAVRAFPMADDQNNPVWVLANRPAPDVALLLTGSEQDAGTAGDIDAIKAAAQPPTEVYTAITTKGGHNTGVWKAEEPQNLDWLSSQLIGPVTPPRPPVPVASAGSAAYVFLHDRVRLMVR